MKAVASHTDPESCVGGRKGADEALTGARAGWVLSLENETKDRSADVVPSHGRQHHGHRYREVTADSAWSKTPCTHGNSCRRNWEIPCLTAERAAARAVNPQEHDGDERTGEVGQARSTVEAPEQGRWCVLAGGGGGGKGPGQGESSPAQPVYRTQSRP